MRKIVCLYISAALLLLSSCSLQKRAYRPGYHVQWAANVKETKSAEPALAFSRQGILPSLETRTTTVSSPLLADVRYRPAPVFTGSRTYLDDCDTLVLRNEGEIKARVFLVTDTEIKYKFCNNLGGAMLVIAKNDVAMIKYSNGRRDVFTPGPSPVVDDIYERNIRKAADNGMWAGIAAFLFTFLPILGALGGIISAIVAISLGRKALRLIGTNARAEALYGRRARAGIILGIVYLCLVALVIFAVLAIVFSYFLI
jgi:hypothetical protein